MSKMVSIRNEPVTSSVMFCPKVVAIGMSELRRACRRTACRAPRKKKSSGQCDRMGQDAGQCDRMGQDAGRGTRTWLYSFGLRRPRDVITRLFGVFRVLLGLDDGGQR